MYSAVVSTNHLQLLQRMLRAFFFHVSNLIPKIILAFFCISSLYIIYDWITIMGYSKHEFDMINMFCFPNKNFIIIIPLPLHNGHFLVSPRWPLWRGFDCTSFQCPRRGRGWRGHCSSPTLNTVSMNLTR